MADLRGVIFEKGAVGPNILGGDDSVSALVATMAAIPGGMEDGGHYIFYSQDDVEAAGLTEGFDALDENVWRHCSEFFRMVGGRGELHFMPLLNTTANADVAAHAQGLLLAAKGRPRQVAFAFSMNGLAADLGEVVHLDGLPIQMHDAIPLAQGLANSCHANNYPLRVLLEGVCVKRPASAMADLRDLGYDAENVALVIGQDWEHAESKQGMARFFADVGTALGCLAIADVGQNMGENEDPRLDLADVTVGRWNVAGLSSHETLVEAAADLQTLEDKGYVFGVEYFGMDGYRWNSDHTCVEVVIDAEGNINEHKLGYGRIMDKAQRELYLTLLPKVKTRHKLDPTGKLPPGVVKYLEGLGDAVFVRMELAGEISSGKTIVDPDSDLIGEKTLRVSFSIQPFGELGEIRGTMNLKTNL